MTPAPDVSVDKSSEQVHLYTRRVESWGSTQAELQFFGQSWAFRGQCNAAWSIRCHLDRKRGTVDPIHAEANLVSEFKRKAHLFLPTSREPETDLEWLSLFQHHGGPTRLIDFTRSPLIAAFFALESLPDSDPPECAVWALDEFAAKLRTVKRLHDIDPELSWLREHHAIEGVIGDRLRVQPQPPFVAPVEPSRVNARMMLQQGVFMCLGDPGRDLFGNLAAAVQDEPPLQVVKIVFPRSIRSEALQALRRLGISREALFPGLDGLAQSLGDQLLSPSNINKTALLQLLGRPQGWPGSGEQEL